MKTKFILLMTLPFITNLFSAGTVTPTNPYRISGIYKSTKVVAKTMECSNRSAQTCYALDIKHVQVTGLNGASGKISFEFPNLRDHLNNEEARPITEKCAEDFAKYMTEALQSGDIDGTFKSKDNTVLTFPVDRLRINQDPSSKRTYINNNPLDNSSALPLPARNRVILPLSLKDSSGRVVCKAGSTSNVVLSDQFREAGKTTKKVGQEMAKEVNQARKEVVNVRRREGRRNRQWFFNNPVNQAELAKRRMEEKRNRNK